MASAIAHTLADTTPSRTASPPSVPKPAVPNEHYFLPPTVFVPDGSGNDVDFFRAENAALDHAQQGDGNKKKDSSSSSSAKSGAKGESSENLGRLFP
ncbi:hypothetical protein ESCO_002504 [Escovopsis weberi]|uniref:Uncharacterized protein n=1 Tax=Escovopsis weberi TaxID=150374 RepID=A0A0M8N1Q6_ESCWE|nr:hypothetical protein ESCO_002504 [Escovopsis weberi]